jgi:hypothetical protein
MAVHFAKFSSQKPAASINSADGKNKDFSRVDLEKRGFFVYFIWAGLSGWGEKPVKNRAYRLAIIAGAKGA